MKSMHEIAIDKGLDTVLVELAQLQNNLNYNLTFISCNVKAPSIVIVYGLGKHVRFELTSNYEVGASAPVGLYMQKIILFKHIIRDYAIVDNEVRFEIVDTQLFKLMEHLLLTYVKPRGGKGFLRIDSFRTTFMIYAYHNRSPKNVDFSKHKEVLKKRLYDTLGKLGKQLTKLGGNTE